MELNNKLTILNMIKENKDILFGKFTEQLTHEVKINKWKEIAEQLKALGIFTKDWKYLRDTTWQNWRKRTMEKKDNRNQTGSGGGKKYKYDDADELIFKIIGKDSPVMEGLNVPESSGSNENIIILPLTEGTPQRKSNTSPSPEVSTAFHAQKRKPRNSISELDLPKDYMDLRHEKMKLEVALANEKLEIAKRERYKLDLELFKLERELEITQPSNFTIPLYVQTGSLIVDCTQDHQNSDNILQEAIKKSL